MIPAVAPPFAMTRWTPQTRQNCASLSAFRADCRRIDVPIQPNGHPYIRLPRDTSTCYLDGYVSNSYLHQADEQGSQAKLSFPLDLVLSRLNLMIVVWRFGEIRNMLVRIIIE
jgi:hypothetical protein